MGTLEKKKVTSILLFQSIQSVFKAALGRHQEVSVQKSD